jgi:ferredoxin
LHKKPKYPFGRNSNEADFSYIILNKDKAYKGGFFMVIEKDTILYYSGTGNSLQVARDIKNEIKGANISLCRIASLAVEERIEVKAKTLGIVFPVTYARLPLIVESVIEKLDISKDTYVFAIATHGGGPAETLKKLGNLLKSKGAMLNSGFLVYMTGNNVFSYGAASIEKQNKAFEKEKKKVKKIARVISERKNQKPEMSKLLIDTLIDRCFIKTTDKIMENLHKRDEEFWINDNCNGCKLCERICPVNNINFDFNKPNWKHSCEQCTACIQYCPKEAIQWGRNTLKRKRYRNPNIGVNELLGL